MQELSVSLFGTPQIRCGNEEISIQRRKDLALLIYLVVSTQSHSRDTLAALLWPDLSQADARSNLRKSVSRLKHQLGEEVLQVSSSQVGLSPSLSLHLDISLFQNYMRCAREHEHPHVETGPQLTSECQEALEQAAQLYHADFLAGFSVPDSTIFEEWQFFQFESLRNDLAEVLEHLTLHHLSLGEYSAGIESCRRWLALDRYRELPHRQLMRLYALSGQQTAALRQFDECSRILREELDTQPEEETRQLYEAIRQKKLPAGGETAPPIPPGTGPTPFMTLPRHPVPFVGRKNELEQITRLLADPACRLLTLLGPGGNGKTRLAVQFASMQLNDAGSPYKDGVWFIALAPLREQQSVVFALADCFQLAGQVRGADTGQKLLGRLHGRRMLLVLDNFEHLIGEDTLHLLLDILSIAPQTRILVTSRERLNLQGETILRVDGLETPVGETVPPRPDADFPPPAFSALQLFEQCARRAEPSFQISTENYSLVAQICQKLQGMPLAIEMAASWITVLSLQEIMAEIAQSPGFLESSLRDLPDRQRSLRAVFDSSWNLLDRQSRPRLKALSVFRSSFTREAAQAVSGASAKVLLQLTNSSWLQKLSNGRYQLHELLRQFAFEKLSAENVTLAQIQEQFCDYYARYASALWEKMKGPEQALAFSGIDSEFENIRSAWLWLAERDGLETAVHDILPILFHYCERNGKSPLLADMIDAGLRTLAAPEGDADRQRMEIILRTAKGAFFGDGFPIRLSSYDGVFAYDHEVIQRAWALSRRMTFSDLGLWGIFLAFIYGRVIDQGEGLKKLEELLPRFQEENRGWETAYTYLHLANLLHPGRDANSAQRERVAGYLSRALKEFTSRGDRINVGRVLIQAGELKIAEQDLHGAIQQLEAARSNMLAMGEWETSLSIFWRIGDAYLQLGQFQKAYDCFEEIARTYFDNGRLDQGVTALSKLSYEKVRYGELSEAQHLRQRCIDIIHETGIEYQYAWNYWEMGEILRVLGKFEEAREWYERALPIFEKHQDKGGSAFYYRGLGDLAYASREYTAALTAYMKSSDLALSSLHPWTLIYSLAGMAKAELRLNDLEAARQHLNEAVRLTNKEVDRGITLVMLVSLADLYACRGELVPAVELGSLVMSHVSSWRETKGQAADLLAGLKKSMSALEFRQAQKRGQKMDLWNVIEQLAARQEPGAG